MTTINAGRSIAPKPSPRAPRPNYRRTHAKPLPLDVFPLPPLIPHNPLSLIQIAYVYLSHLLSPPNSHGANVVHGHYSPESNSVHVTDAASVRLLWERGFFGKGSLSRSEPTWLEREKRRRGLLGQDTSEAYTQQRREERRKMKTERAKKEREAIEEKLVEERERLLNQGLTDKAEENGSLSNAIEPLVLPSAAANAEDPPVNALDDTILPATAVDLVSAAMETEGSTRAMPSAFTRGENPPLPVSIQDEEHLQLTAEEAFFLAYALGILHIHDSKSNISIPSIDLMTLFRSHSYFPPLPRTSLTPYDPFLLSYAAYHHFRSLGWVVRPGIKFAVDWLLYLRGPAFTHAEFAVIVLPAFRDAFWWDEARRKETVKMERKDWWWLHCVQRVQAQVRKGLVLCWVDVPRPDAVGGAEMSREEKEAAETKGAAGREFDIGKMLKRYRVRDMVVKRWIPNRSRD